VLRRRLFAFYTVRTGFHRLDTKCRGHTIGHPASSSPPSRSFRFPGVVGITSAAFNVVNVRASEGKLEPTGRCREVDRDEISEK